MVVMVVIYLKVVVEVLLVQDKKVRVQERVVQVLLRLVAEAEDVMVERVIK